MAGTVETAGTVSRASRGFRDHKANKDRLVRKVFKASPVRKARRATPENKAP